MSEPVPSIGELLMLGVGTVFCTLVFVLLALILGSLVSASELPSTEEFGLGVLLYGGFGAVIASVICLVGAIPLILLFRLVFSQLRKRGIGERLSAILTSGGLALLGTFAVLIAATTSKAITLPTMAWPVAIVPAFIAVGLSTRLSFDGELGQ